MVAVVVNYRGLEREVWTIAGLAGATVLLVSLSFHSTAGAQATENEPETIEMVNESGLVASVEVDQSPEIQKSKDGKVKKSKKGTYDLSELEGELLSPYLPPNLVNAQMDTPRTIRLNRRNTWFRTREWGP